MVPAKQFYAVCCIYICHVRWRDRSCLRQELETENASLRSETASLERMTPQQLAELVVQTKRGIEAANRWTDNIVRRCLRMSAAAYRRGMLPAACCSMLHTARCMLHVAYCTL